MVAGHVHGGDTFHGAGLVGNGLRPRLLVGLRHRRGMFEHRRDVVLLVRLHRREFHVGLLGDRTGLRDFHGHAGDATQFVFGENGTRRKAPYAAVDHPHAESAGLTVGIGGNALHPATTGSAAATTTAATSSAESTATRTGRATAGPEVHGGTGQRRGHGETHIGVAAAGEFAFGQHDVGQPLETRLEWAALRRVREHLAEQITRIEREGGAGSELLQKITTGRAHGWILSK